MASACPPRRGPSIQLEPGCARAALQHASLQHPLRMATASMLTSSCVGPPQSRWTTALIEPIRSVSNLAMPSAKRRQKYWLPSLSVSGSAEPSDGSAPATIKYTQSAAGPGLSNMAGGSFIPFRCGHCRAIAAHVLRMCWQGAPASHPPLVDLCCLLRMNLRVGNR